MKISELLDENNVFIDLNADSKQDVIKVLVQALEPKVGSDKVTQVLDAVIERESIMSTGVGKGLAIPHGRCPGLEESHAAFARLDKPIEYGAIDKEPVNLVFLLVGPQSQNSLHIKMLSRISRLMNSNVFREQLLDCKSKDEIREAFRVEEEQFIRI